MADRPRLELARDATRANGPARDGEAVTPHRAEKKTFNRRSRRRTAVSAANKETLNKKQPLLPPSEHHIKRETEGREEN